MELEKLLYLKEKFSFYLLWTIVSSIYNDDDFLLYDLLIQEVLT